MKLASILKQKDLNQCEGIVLELEHGRTIIGKFSNFFENGSAIELRECKDYYNNLPLGNKKRFYENNIKSIKFLTLNENETPQTIQMTNEQKCQMECTNYNYKLIGQADCNFYDAVEDLSVQPAVAVYSVGKIDNCPNGRLSTDLLLLCFATKEAIYLFDVLQLKDLNELKKIFKDKNIVKVMFNSSGLCDNLKQHYDIDIDGIFDIFISDATILEDGTIIKSSSLEDCIIKNLNVNINNDEKLIWQRPYISQNFIYAAKRCNYLLYLYNHIIRKKYISKFLNVRS